MLDVCEARGLDRIASDAGLPAPTVLALLSGLELRTRAAKLPGSRWLKLASTAQLSSGHTAMHESVLSSGMPEAVPVPQGVR